MRSLRLIFNSPPFSINSAYYRNRQRTKECRAWGNQIHSQMSQPSVAAAIKLFKQSLDSHTKLSVELNFKYPEKKLYTIKGEVSRRSMDLSNIEKLLIDLIFDKRFQDRITDCGNIVESLEEDDKKIMKLISTKSLSDDDTYQIEAIISII